MIIASPPSVFATPASKLSTMPNCVPIDITGMPEPRPMASEARTSATKALHLNFAMSRTSPMIVQSASRSRPFGGRTARVGDIVRSLTEKQRLRASPFVLQRVKTYQKTPSSRRSKVACGVSAGVRSIASGTM